MIAAIKNFAVQLWAYFNSVLTVALDGVLWLLSKFLYVAFDGFLTVITAMFTAINMSSLLTTYALNWASVPTQLIWFVNAVSIPSGIAIITAAIGIRMLLNLIPAAVTRI